jgi:hypothetical protein
MPKYWVRKMLSVEQQFILSVTVKPRSLFQRRERLTLSQPTHVVKHVSTSLHFK